MVPALLTNAWAGWLSDPLTHRHFSRVVIEGCGELTGYLRSGSLGRVVFVAPGSRLNLDPTVLTVQDGVVEAVAVAAGREGATVEVRTSAPTGATLTLAPGTPARAVLDFPVTPLVALFTGKVVVVDAGHGGPDLGGRGPIDLLEKHEVLDLATRLEKLLARVGAVPLLTRRGDVGVAAETRERLVREARPAAVLSLHTHADRDWRVKGFAAFAHGERARPLAQAIRGALAARLGGFVDRGLHLSAGSPFSPAAPEPGTSGRDAAAAWDGPPAVTVETVTISNPVEEGWLRSCVFRQRVAQAVFNGLAAWLRVTNPGPEA